VSAQTIGLTVSITAVPVNSIILMELGLFDTDLGATVIAAGVIDDIISFVALGVIQQYSGSGGGTEGGVLALGAIKVAVFLGAVLVCEHLIRSHAERLGGWTSRLEHRLKTAGSYFSLLLIVAVGISLLAEWAGMQFVIGAFFAGLLLSELTGPAKIAEASSLVRGVTFGFFGPLAFTFIGTELVLGSVEAMPLLVFLLLVVALGSKYFGGYVGARLSRFSSRESSLIGFLMNSRGFVELVIATTAYQLGLIDQGIFSIVVSIGILTTIISPIAARNAMKRAGIAKLRADSAA